MEDDSLEDISADMPGINGFEFNPLAGIGTFDRTNDIKELLYEMGAQKSSATLFREDIIREVFSILISEGKPNCLLVGPAGCGKTNIVEELSRRMKWKTIDVPRMLYGYKVYSVNLSDLVIGCNLVGDLESKVKALTDYLESDEHKAILFLDEIHQIVSGQEHYLKIAEMLKPALSRGRFKVIGATTTQEAKLLDKNPAFNRRFTRVAVNELSKEQTKTVLERAVKGMERHYESKIQFDSSIADLIVSIADEFCSAGSHRPDNALTLMDRAIANCVLDQQIKPSGNGIRLTREQVAETALRLTAGTRKRKRFNEKEFREALSGIHGQDEAIESIIKGLKLHDLHLRPRNKPLTFLFAGPSGVGKSEVAKIIANEYFGEKPIVLNMAEYGSYTSAKDIMNELAGYSDTYSKKEYMFDALASNPYQLIVLDGFEKCSPAVQNMFTNAFDDGVIKLSSGTEIDLSKSIIISTVNTDHLRKTVMGFTDVKKGAPSSTQDLSRLLDTETLSGFAVRCSFAPIDYPVFKRIIEDILNYEIEEIASGQLGRQASDYITKSLSDNMIEHLARSSFDAKLGAKPAKTAVREFIDTLVLSSLIPLQNINTTTSS
jgi:ATP-dependent Clp protease ATP-binding subunit ClpA